ncbi:hypothetical protein CJ010_10990 [Azoarcus sp. DD4]|uniref:DUF2946 domain-containing protein n=1 Tax=Azoarcus sp. DD4 TaxID=2027405 RepID=UPI00112AFFBE|nr:DUF2946 domain-containing protein [Azoarcus sp. DD4]QDF97015.1 hypothetical protein CJ010_10990 [Azoarcus sp. DD4]
MIRIKFLRRLTAWIASYAILLGALAPAVTQTLAWLERGSADKATSLEVSAAADILTSVGAEEDGHEACESHEGHAGHQDQGLEGHEGGGHEAAGSGHCPFCGTHAGSFGLPPTERPAAAQPAGTHAFRPHLYDHAPRPLFAWAAAHPRAPPVRA